MGKFQVAAPGNMEELKCCLKSECSDTLIISGGTDLMLRIKNHPEMDFKLIDISGVKELDYIKAEDGYIKIGARTTFTRIAENSSILKYGTCLAQASSQVGSAQIRNWGTIGGNIGNSSPAGDSLPALCALNAEVLIMDGDGNIEVVPVQDVVTGIGKNVIGQGRVITEVSFPLRGEGYISAFEKIGSRSQVTIARLNIGMALEYNGFDNSITEANVALGALGTKVIVSDRINSLLNNRKADDVLKEEFADALTREVDTAIPGRASQVYKRLAVKGLAYDVWDKLFNGKILSSQGGI